MDFEEKYEESVDEIIVLDSDSDENVENEDVFEMKVPVKEAPEIITLDSDDSNTESKIGYKKRELTCSVSCH